MNQFLSASRIDPSAYRREGYVLVKQLFDPAEITAILDEAKRVFVAQMQRLGLVEAPPAGEPAFADAMQALFAADLPALTNCGKHVQHLISLHRLSLDERIISVLRTLGLGSPSVSTRPLLHFNSPRLSTKEVYWRLTWHQDWRTMQGSLDSVVVWMPMVAVDRALGALEIIPRSHHAGLRSSEWIDGYGHLNGAVDDAEVVPVEVSPGDALFFSAFLAHRSGTNSTDAIRWSCQFRYNNLDEATFIARGVPHPYVYRPLEELVTPEFPGPADMAAVFRD